VENFIIDVGPIQVQDLGRTDTPPPDLIIVRTFTKSILMPTMKGLILEFPFGSSPSAYG